MVKATGQELLLLKQILQMLNEAFPVHPIPVKMRIAGELKSTTTTLDEHFLAYKNQENIWWICVRDYGAWKDAAEALRDCCCLIKQQLNLTAHACHVHPVSMGRYKQLHQRKQVLMLGKVTWAK